MRHLLTGSLHHRSSVGAVPPVGTRTVIWDSGCRSCSRWIRVFKALDWFHVHRFIGSAEPEAFIDSRVTPARAATALQLLTDSDHFEGYAAVRAILGACPATAWLSPVLRLGWVAERGERTYAAVAQARVCQRP